MNHLIAFVRSMIELLDSQSLPCGEWDGSSWRYLDDRPDRIESIVAEYLERCGLIEVDDTERPVYRRTRLAVEALRP